MLLKSKEFEYFGAHVLGCLLVHQKQLFKSRFLHIDKRFSSSSCNSIVATVLRQMVPLCVVRDVCFQGSFLKKIVSLWICRYVRQNEPLQIPSLLLLSYHTYTECVSCFCGNHPMRYVSYVEIRKHIAESAHHYDKQGWQATSTKWLSQVGKNDALGI